MTIDQLGTVGIVGAGLIGTSIGMALSAAGVDVLLRDQDPEQASLAVARKAGRLWPEGVQVDHAVIAVPPHAVAAVLLDLQRSKAAVSASDTASVKGQVVAEARVLGCDLSAFCPAHPIAGRERGGAISAQIDLFRDSTWALCPTAETGDAARRSSGTIGDICGAWLLVLPPERHDELMAQLSHLPQVVASALAAQAVDGLLSQNLELAGSGLRDTTRLADSDPTLWASILEGNRQPVADSLERLAATLTGLAGTLRAGSVDDVWQEVQRFLLAGRDGRRRLPAKAGQPPPNWGWVGVVVPDRKGELARLLVAVDGWGINVEDVRVEHSLGQLEGTAEIAVNQTVLMSLIERLEDAGWRAYQLE